MTTAHSPLKFLRKQADEIAKMLKESASRDINDLPAGKIREARSKPSITFGVVMDDKVIKLEMLWTEIEKYSQKDLSDSILFYMKESRETVQ